MEEKKENRGGKREGAGRKKKDGKKMLLLLELDLCKALDGVNNKSELINDALRFALFRKGEFEEFEKELLKRKEEERRKRKSYQEE